MNLTVFSEHLLILLPPLLLSFVCTIAGSLWIDRLYRQEKDEDNGRFRYYYFTDLSDKKDFDYFVEHQDALERMRPTRSSWGASFEGMKYKIRQLER